MLLWAVLSLAWNLLSGYSGYFSFGHAAFWGLGAYTVALGMIYLDLTPWVGIPLCAIVGAVAGAIIGYPDLSPARALFRAGDARLPAGDALCLPMARLSGADPADEARVGRRSICSSPIRAFMCVLALGLLVLSLLISLKVENSRFGMALLAIKQNEPAAEAAGIDTWRWKMLALMLSGALAAVAGGFYAVICWW